MSARVLLLFPPPSDPAQPYASLPALAAYLRLHDVEVKMADLNIEGLHYLLSPERLNSAAGAVAAWVREAESLATLDAMIADRYLRAVHCDALASMTISRVPSALAAVRRKETYDSMATFCAQMGVVDAAYRLVSAASYPTVATRHRLDPGIDVWDPQALLAFALEPEATPFHGWLRARVRALIEEFQPDLVGVSLTFPDQLPLAFLALAAVREVDPDVVTCLGGATASRLAMRFDHLGPVLPLVDTVVVGEGEAALLELAVRARSRAPLGGVSNTICTTSDGCVRGPQGSNVAMDSLPVPLYADMDLDAYLAPEPVLLVSASRACYWGKCKFCDVSGTATEAYRQRSLDRVIADFEELNNTTGARHFMFGDLAIGPERLARMGDRLAGKGLDVQWLCQARLESGFSRERIGRMASGGCRILVFGLESASQRMLDRMDKGTRLDETASILAACAENGIAVNLQTFVGFPGETEAEARETARFVIAQRHAVTSVALTSFKLIEGTSAFEESLALGLGNLRQPKGTLDVLWDYDVDSGLTAEQADALVRELYQELMLAFPAVGNGLSWNAHALLLVSSSGPDALRPAETGPVTAGAHLRLRPDVALRRLPFNVGDIASCVRESVKDGSLYGARQASLRHAGSFVHRRPTWTLLDPHRPRAIPLTDAVAQTLVSGAEPTDVVSRRPSAAERLQLTGELIRLLEAGLVHSDRPAIPDAVLTAEPEAFP